MWFHPFFQIFLYKTDTLYQRNYFKTMKTQDYNFRKHQLEMLYQKIKQYQKEIEQALYSDLKKPAFEAYSTEIGLANVSSIINFIIFAVDGAFSDGLTIAQLPEAIAPIKGSITS